MGGVSQPAVTKLLKGKLSSGVAGDRVDIDDPSVFAWLLSKGWTDAAPTSGRKKARGRVADPTPTRAAGKSKVPAPTAPTPPPVDERRAEIDSLELETKRERLRERQLKNELSEGKVILREEVAAHIFGALATMFKRFIEDVPHTAVSRLYSAARAGESLEAGKAIFVEIVQGQLEAVKAQAIETVRDP